MGRLLGEVASRIRGRPWGHNATRLAILEAARRIAACDGPEAVSLSRIADEAGFARPTVYGHFRNKEELLVSIVADDMTTLGRLMRKATQKPWPHQDAKEEPAAEEMAKTEDAAPAEESTKEDENAEAASSTEESADEEQEAANDHEFTSEELSTAISEAQPHDDILELLPSDALPDGESVHHEEEVQPPEPDESAQLWQEEREPVAEADESDDGIESALAETAPEPPTPEDNPRAEHPSFSSPPRVDAWLERRLRVFEHTLAEISARIDKTEHTSERAVGQVAEGMRDMQQNIDAAEARAKEIVEGLLRRVEASDQRNAAAIATLRAELMRMGNSEMTQPQLLVHEDKLSFIPAPPEEPKPKREPSASYLDAARRAASAAAELGETEHAGPIMGSIKWPANDEARKRYTRYIISGVAVLALTLIGAGLFLRHSASGSKSESMVPQMSSANAAIESTDSHAPLGRLTKLANSGDAQAELIVGLKYMAGGGSDASAAQWVQRAANGHEPVAQYVLGTMYERGLGVGKDLVQAAHWYQQAAEQGNRKAMYRLGIAYAQGEGVDQDYAQAANWFEKAANAGLADAQFNIAVLYERGEGVPQSLLDAYKWYAIAASHGDKESAARVAALSAQMTPDDLQVAEKTAQSFAPADFDRQANLAPTITDVAGP